MLKRCPWAVLRHYDAYLDLIRLLVALYWLILADGSLLLLLHLNLKLFDLFPYFQWRFGGFSLSRPAVESVVLLADLLNHSCLHILILLEGGQILRDLYMKS